ncbi:uncharacterized protein (DUF1015 family) [Nonomuraea jabiensis]|uniref:Uncharacterized protein (DUF1015 family) n=1 Tax=Nonomuraea jabiensis TaxID=882448 RepID=A0A7W9LHH8_9ACTN|nr:uncharacterized protein (DUF1015 family) [Nonomuraea jabiensis]
MGTPSSLNDDPLRRAAERARAATMGRLPEGASIYGSMPGMGTPELPMPDGLVLRPFRGVRFAVEDPAKVTSPPYDLISDADVDALLDSHPNNVVRLILPRSPRGDSSGKSPAPHRQQEPNQTPSTAPHRLSTQGEPAAMQQQESAPPTPSDAGHETRYATARNTLRAWLDTGVLVPDDVPALYVYEQSGPNVLQRGLIGDVGLADPGQRIILPHEDVMPGPITDRLALMSTTQANLEPIFLLYNGDNGTATRLVDEVASKRRPLVSAHTEDGLTHRLWAITDTSEINAINADLHDRQALIADGHHRYATYRVLQRQEHATRRSPQPEPSAPTATTPEPPTSSRAQSPTAPEAGSSVPPKALSPSAAESEPADVFKAHPLATTTTHPATTSEAEQPDATPAARPDAASDALSPPFAVEPAAQPSHPAMPSEPQASSPSGNLDPDGKPSIPEVPSATDVSGAAGGPREAGSGRSSGGGRSTPQPVVGPWDFGLALLVDSTAYPPNLQAIHRVIPGLPLAEAVAKAKGAWRVHDFGDLAQGLAALKEAAEPAFLLAGEGGTHLLTNPDPVQLARAMPPDHSDRWNSLNTSILTEFVLPKVWGMRDDEQAVRIVHHDTDAAVRLAIRTGGTAVLLKPLAVDDVLAVAAGGERVPRKSTSFGPKPRTGLVLRTFAID